MASKKREIPYAAMLGIYRDVGTVAVPLRRRCACDGLEHRTGSATRLQPAMARSPDRGFDGGVW
jgi:hypothetical protein